MRAILDNDIIVTLTMSATEGVEIGDIPKNTGFERLRFNGVEVVDLANLSAFWVKPISGGFMLHSVQVPGSQYIEMAYEDRKYLYINGGTPNIKTQEQIDEDEYQRQLKILKNKLRLKLLSTVGDMQDQNMQTLAYVMALIIYARQQPQALADFFDDIIPTIKDIFPLSRWESILKTSGVGLKNAIEDYYNNLDLLG